MFQELPILAFRRSRNLHDLLGCKSIVDGKQQRLSKKKKNGFSTKCFSKSGILCCKQVLHTHSFKSSSVTQIFPMTLTVSVNYWYTLWNVESAVFSKLENQNLTLD